MSSAILSLQTLAEWYSVTSWKMYKLSIQFNTTMKSFILILYAADNIVRKLLFRYTSVIFHTEYLLNFILDLENNISWIPLVFYRKISTTSKWLTKSYLSKYKQYNKFVYFWYIKEP